MTSPTELTIEILEREDRIIIEKLNGLYEDCLDDLRRTQAEVSKLKQELAKIQHKNWKLEAELDDIKTVDKIMEALSAGEKKK